MLKGMRVYIKKTVVNNKGYSRVSLNKNGKLKSFLVHGLSQGNISSCCLGKRNKCGNFKWKYKNEN